MSKFVAKNIDRIIPGFTKWMKKNKAIWHDDLPQPYDKTMHPMYGKEQTEHCKKKNSELAKKRTGKKNSFYGRKHGEETRRNWSILRSDPKNGLCKSYGFKGKKHSEASKKKTSKSLMGRTYSAQSIALMSQKRKEYWERKRNENGI